jgi:anthranilate synthase component 1
MDQKMKSTETRFQSHRLMPVVRRLSADFETPASVYLKLADERPSFLLESVTGGEHLARYSFIGIGLDEAFILKEDHFIHKLADETTSYPIGPGHDPFEILRQFMNSHELDRVEDLPRFSGGLVGYLGYDAVRYIEPRVSIQISDDIPEAIYMVANTLVAFDHAFGQIILIANARVNGNEEAALTKEEARLDALEERLSKPLDLTNLIIRNSFGEQVFTNNVDQQTFEEAVEKAKSHITAGDIFQVVLSQRLTRKTNADPFSIYRALRSLNPSPYMFFLNFAELAGPEPFHIIGASPELHVRLEDDLATLRPIAGTRQRGRTDNEDKALENELLADEKERAEHIMLVDLGRNDLGRVCTFGSVDVKDFMSIERYSHVMHICSEIEGHLAPDLDEFDLLAATFPAGTVSGAPKIRAMQIIEDLEPTSRGPYAGAIGYFSYDGSMDSCITIRTLTMQGQEISVQAGAGIVADSVPKNEYEETLNKARALSEAVMIAEGDLKP